MTLLRYEATDSLGLRLRGELVAADVQDLKQKLQAQGLRLAHARPATPQTPAASLPLPAKQLPDLLRDIATLDKSGISLLQGLHDLQADQGSPQRNAILQELSRALERGANLAEAFCVDAPRLS